MLFQKLQACARVAAGKEGCVPWLVGELGNTSTHWCTRAELAAVLGSLARIPALSAAMVRGAWHNVDLAEQWCCMPNLFCKQRSTHTSFFC